MNLHSPFIRSNRSFQTLRKEIEGAGGSVDRIRMGRHLVVYWSVDGRSFVQTVPCTSRSASGILNLRADIRRKIRETVKKPH